MRFAISSSALTIPACAKPCGKLPRNEEARSGSPEPPPFPHRKCHNLHGYYDCQENSTLELSVVKTKDRKTQVCD